MMEARHMTSAPEEKTVSASYLPSLDGIRACAFLLVFFAHAGLDKVVPGGLGVTIFFFLSGYLITTLLRREFASTAEISIKHFYIRRSLRILPPMYLTLGLACFVVSFLPSMRSATWLGILSTLGYFYNYANLIHNDPARLPAGIGVIWSLMIEEHFYLVFPFAYSRLLRSCLTRYQQAALLGSLCLGALLWRCCLVLVLHTPVLTLPRWTYSATDARFDSILWGCILAIVWNPVFGDGSPRLNRNAGKLAGGGLLLLAATLMIRNPILRETARYSLQSIALLPIFYYCVAQPNAWMNRALQWPALRWIGWLSYSMYLIHEFLFELIEDRFHFGAPVKTIAVFALAVLYALILRYLVEQPSRGLHKALASRRTAQASPRLSNVAPIGEAS
jgi:peptidoglycan/LPS O-acetylase OafA/YrhL